MLKLLRIKETNIFSIVEEYEANKNAEVKGFVRLNERTDEVCIKNLTSQSERCLKQIRGLIEEKRKEVYSAHNIKAYIGIRPLLYCYFKEKRLNYIFFDEVRNMVAYITEELISRGLVEKYNIPLDLSQKKLEQTVNISKDTLCLSLDKNIISLKLGWDEMYKSIELALLDKTIAEIISKFVKEQN